MKKTHSFFLKFACIILLTGIVLWCGRSSQALETTPKRDVGNEIVAPPEKMQASKIFGRLPLYFFENRGQFHQKVKVYSRSGAKGYYFTPKEIILTFPSREAGLSEAALKSRRISPAAGPRGFNVVKLTPLGMRSREIKAFEPQEGRINYFIGADPRRWAVNLPVYKGVVYREAYPGIDLKFYGSGQKLEYDIIIKPGGDPSRVKLQFQGIQNMKVTGTGDLAIRLADGGFLLQQKPRIFQEINGKTIECTGNFKVFRQRDPGICGFSVTAYDARFPLTIDPVLYYSTYLGGSDYDTGYAVATDSAGCTYVTGITYSNDFPLKTPYQSWIKGYANVFVTKINRGGNALVFSTYLGGSIYDVGYGLAVDKDGNVCVSGTTYSEDFPTQNALQATLKGAPDAFVFKLNATGSNLIYSTFLGGTDDDEAYGLAVDGSGNAYVTGYTGSSDFTTKLPFQSQLQGAYNAFVTKISAAGALVYSTYLGGNTDDSGNGIAVDGSGNAYVTGFATSDNFPLKNPFQAQLKGFANCFISKFTPDGATLLYSTYLGGSGGDEGNAIAVDANGNVYVAGDTSSNDFPTQTPIQPNNQGPVDAFVSKINAAGSTLVYSTYLGGSSGEDYAEGIAVDSKGNACVTGWTESTDFPVVKPLQAQLGGLINAFVAKFNAAGKTLIYSTYLGGSAIDQGLGIAVDRLGNALVTGGAGSSNFPTRNPFQEKLNTLDDGFVTKIMDSSNLPGVMLLLMVE